MPYYESNYYRSDDLSSHEFDIVDVEYLFKVIILYILVVET